MTLNRKMKASILASLLSLGVLGAPAAPEPYSSNVSNSSLPSHYGVLVFPSYELIDPLGPLEILTVLSLYQPSISFSLISNDTLDPVDNGYKFVNKTFWNPHAGIQVVPEYTLKTAANDIDALIVPGGFGNLVVPTSDLQPYIDFIAERYPRLKYLFSVCTGAGMLARAHVLDGRNATTNKAAFDQVAAFGPDVNWVRKARWVVDGNIWTTSGVSAGIDGMFALVEYLYGKSQADEIGRYMEYVRIADPTNDPFAIE